MGRLREYFEENPDEALGYEARRYSDNIIKSYGLSKESSENDVMSAVYDDFEKDKKVLKKVPIIGGFLGKAGLWGLDTKTKHVKRRLSESK